ncbi:hypothetical protein [Listeria booriae]|uniref:DUF3139 domain-containing protein n=1 Tax=Listeria booriae TaxID=1552123 RepID=A0A7X0XPN8_9LIST|nr:hypothetical protein [Listeria booriae]MBC1778276.1 hypothetical protein [Listeria booriae]
MKKWKIILLVISLLIVLPILAYIGYIHFRITQAENRIDETIAASKIPEDQVIVVEKIMYNSKVFAYEWFPKSITTKKDYANWKKIVTEKQQFLNGVKLTSKNKSKLDSPKNCELTYSFVYESDSKSVSSSYSCAGNEATPSQVKEYFSYTILANKSFK